MVNKVEATAIVGEPRWHMGGAVVAALVLLAGLLLVALMGFTDATAFSPTDAMPLAPWAKIAMTAQSLISLALLGLVIARAVNLFQ